MQSQPQRPRSHVRQLSRATLFAIAFVGGLSAGLACRGQNDAHCFYHQGDATCAERYPDGDRPFCATSCADSPGDDGCVADRPDDDACYSPCGAEKTVAECDGVADTGSGSTVSDGPTTLPTDTSEPTTDDMTTMGSVSGTMTSGETESDSASETTSSGCSSSDECTDAAAPICQDNACVPCTEAGDGDAECTAKDANAPACRDDGHCVQCTSVSAGACVDTTPVCDDGTSACVGCTYHEQCEGTACDIATGACFEDCVIEVDGDDGDDIMPAIADGCIVVLHEIDGEVSYQEALVVDGITVAILAAPGETPIVQGVGGMASLAASNGAAVYVQGVRFSQNTAEGVSANGAAVYLDRSEVLGNDGGGLVLTNVAGGHLRNTIVGANGGNNFTPTTGIDATNSTIDLLYSTIVLNEGDAADSLQCSGSNGTVRNSILLGTNTSSTSCPGVAVTYSALDQNDGGQGNVNVSPIQGPWFVNPASDFRLTAAGGNAFEGIALWLAGDPPVDFEGVDRPNLESTPDHAGADLP